MPTNKMKSVDYIITAKHYGGSARAYIEKQMDAIFRNKGIDLKFNFNWLAISEHAVTARIEQGQWIADCECGGASFVDPDEPIFFCFSCGNRADNGLLRKVVFPSPVDRAQIEKLLLERPVDDRAGLDDRERAGMARPMIYDELHGGLSRNWNPDETLEDLMEQNQLVETWKKKNREVK